MNRTTATSRVVRSLLAAALLLPGIASAELYCVSTPAQLASAIEAADASASASEVRVRTGSYNIPAAAPQQGVIPHSLRIDGTSDLLLTGGWTGASCQTRTTLNPEQTVLNGGGTAKLLYVEFPIFPVPSTHRVEISGISFRSAFSNNLDSPCLMVEAAAISASERATLVLDRNSFRICVNSLDTSTVSAALQVESSNLNVYMRNNVMVDNAGKGNLVRLIARANTTYFVSNNTFAFNPILGGVGDFDGLSVAGAPGCSDCFFWIVNNVGWNNGDSDSNDFQESTGVTLGVASHNQFGRTALGANFSTINNSNADPRFISSNDLRPRADSPMRNSGAAAPGGLLDFDLFGTPRIQGGRVDRGAHEFEEIFANGFE